MPMRRRRRKERRQRADQGVDKGEEERREEKGRRRRAPVTTAGEEAVTYLCADLSVVTLYLNLEDGELEHTTVSEEVTKEEDL
jgi:class 3 adenylate cyclase